MLAVPNPTSSNNTITIFGDCWVGNPGEKGSLGKTVELSRDPISPEYAGVGFGIDGPVGFQYDGSKQSLSEAAIVERGYHSKREKQDPEEEKNKNQKREANRKNGKNQNSNLFLL